MRLNAKVAIVTGAGSGNGAAIARGFIREGARVVLADINTDSARAVAAGSGAPAQQFLVQQLDVADPSSIDRCVTATLDRFGAIHVLMNNAGIIMRKPFLELTEEDYDRVMRVNAKGVFLCSQAVARVMARQSGGSIIHMSSVSSVIAHPNVVEYGASKGAVAAMTRHMAVDLAQFNIRVNAIAPGTIMTGMTQGRLADRQQLDNTIANTPLGRVGQPEDLVGAAILLASDESAFMTGSHIFVDGGWTVR